MPGNTVILANSALEIVNGQISQPQTAVWVTVSRDPECLVCGDKLRNTLAEGHEEGGVSLADLMDTTGIVLQEDED
jgi:hypothetical protein